MPFSSFGFLLGYHRTSAFIPSGFYGGQEVSSFSVPGSSFSAGVFAEVPLWLISGLSLQGQLSYARQQHTGVVQADRLQQDYQLDFSFAGFELGPRFALNLPAFRPYVFVRGAGQYLLNSSEQLYQARFEEGIIRLSNYDDFLNPPALYYGLSSGAGIQFFYQYDHYISLEANFSRLISGQAYSFASQAILIKLNL